jgi:hypothetical protein
MDESKKTFKFDPATQILHEMLLAKCKFTKEWLLANTRQHLPNSCSTAGYYTKMFYFT